jgi:hypothetical protein
MRIGKKEAKSAQLPQRRRGGDSIEIFPFDENAPRASPV